MRNKNKLYDAISNAAGAAANAPESMHESGVEEGFTAYECPI